MACYLRFIGSPALDVDAFCESTTLPLSETWQRGERRNERSMALNSTSGALIVVSKADFYEFDTQLRDAQAFLAAHHLAIRRAVGFPGIEEVVLDFGTGWRKGAGAQFWRFPAELLRLLGELGVMLELSHYPVSAPENQ